MFIGLEKLGLANEGFMSELKKAFVGRRTYHNLFDFMMMQKQTVNVNRKFDLSKLSSPNDIKDTDTKAAEVIFRRIKTDVNDYDYPETESGILAAAKVRYEDELTKSVSSAVVKLPTVKRSDVTLSTAGYRDRVGFITTRLNQLKSSMEYEEKAFAHTLRYYATGLKNCSKAVNDKRYLAVVQRILEHILDSENNHYRGQKKWHEFFISEYQRELNELVKQAPKDNKK